jgi:thioredoxin-like negative regulator of GroEL
MEPLVTHVAIRVSNRPPVLQAVHRLISPCNSEKSSALQPEWDAAVATGTETLVSFDCSVDNETCRKSDVQAAPEAHLFQAGKRIARYNGPRRAAA